MSPAPVVLTIFSSLAMEGGMISGKKKSTRIIIVFKILAPIVIILIWTRKYCFAI